MMVNHEVHRNLISALRPAAVIRMFGDANQLAPIEPSKKLQEKPSPFQTMLAKHESYTLPTIHRQKEGSNIILNGHRILRGLLPQRFDDFELRVASEPVSIVNDIVMDGLSDGKPDFTDTNNQIIAPSNVGWVGTRALNQMIQGIAQQGDVEHTYLERHLWMGEEQRVCVGDKVIQTVNNYELELFNGEAGVVTAIEHESSIFVDFGDRIVEIPTVLAMEGYRGTFMINPQRDIDLAYVITTHKAQGSEYDHVAYVMSGSRPFTLSRRNLYTGVTRARKTVRVVTDQRALSLSLYRIGK